MTLVFYSLLALYSNSHPGLRVKKTLVQTLPYQLLSNLIPIRLRQDRIESVENAHTNSRFLSLT